MKKVLLSLMTVFLLSFVSFSQSENGLIGKARGVAHECLQTVTSEWEISGSSETVSICFVQGFITRVTFVATYKCHAGEVCPQIARLVATVDFDCDNNVIDYTCY